jgi:hypothetical protein
VYVRDAEYIRDVQSTVPPLQFGLQRRGVRLHLFLAGSRGVLSFVLAFELLLRGRRSRGGPVIASACAHIKRATDVNGGTEVPKSLW